MSQRSTLLLPIRGWGWNRKSCIGCLPSPLLPIGLNGQVQAGGITCPFLKRVGALARWFARMVRKRQVDQLDVWIDRASKASSSLRGFARSLQRDRSAVNAALTSIWSNGQVEGQINRLKLVKRQMYGRANFDLLKARFLYAG